MNERVCVFGGESHLVGVITEPAQSTARRPPAAVLLNAGIIHRVGPNRLYVRLARALAAEGFLALRFDFSGIGDSAARRDTLPFRQSALREVREAIDHLQHSEGAERFLLMGLCSGAILAREMARLDARVQGVVLMNHPPLADGGDPTFRAELSKRNLVRYYGKIASRSPHSWFKALTGKVQYARILEALGYGWDRIRRGMAPSRIRTTRFGQALVELDARAVRALFVYSDTEVISTDLDRMLKTAEHMGKPLRHVVQHTVHQTDHNFTPLHSQDALLQVVCAWARDFL